MQTIPSCNVHTQVFPHKNLVRNLRWWIILFDGGSSWRKCAVNSFWCVIGKQTSAEICSFDRLYERSTWCQPTPLWEPNRCSVMRNKSANIDCRVWSAWVMKFPRRIRRHAFVYKSKLIRSCSVAINGGYIHQHCLYQVVADNEQRLLFLFLLVQLWWVGPLMAS